ncbi:MAG: TlyA family RNA methyltransferase [Ruminococcaceae bacterium]|nr:TlyA family RNA methyltransferase [Oscillospiraceae bacterium]
MRADVYLVENGYAPSRERAKKWIEEGVAFSDGKPIEKPSQEILPGAEIKILDTMPYVGRGGLKLEAALNAFQIDVSGLSALDIGASTGGFTDCLLQHGARSVCAVDSGSGQLAKKLREDPRVKSIEHCNARYLTEKQIGGRVSIIVMDVSFISATYLIPLFPSLLLPGGKAVCLVKPQFEVGRAAIGKGGIVKDPAAHKAAIERVAEAGKKAGMTSCGLIPSPIFGGDGNREFLICLSMEQGASTVDETRIRQVIQPDKGGIKNA